MYFVAIVLTVCGLQLWGANNPFHRDQWFERLVAYLRSLDITQRAPYMLSVLAIGAPSLVVLLLSLWLFCVSPWLFLIFACAVMLYCLGRGDFSETIYLYSQACGADDWHAAHDKAQKLGIPVNQVDEGDWAGLHQATLRSASYRGFERLFAVIFWFATFGPAGALAYRLASFLATKPLSSLDGAMDETVPGDAIAQRWLWIMEWPAARVMGLSFAVTGNFVGCVQRWKTYWACMKSDTAEVMMQQVLGALSVDDAIKQSCDVTRKELDALQGLYTRTLWFWLVAIAIITLI